MTLSLTNCKMIYKKKTCQAQIIVAHYRKQKKIFKLNSSLCLFKIQKYMTVAWYIDLYINNEGMLFNYSAGVFSKVINKQSTIAMRVSKTWCG